MGRPRSDAPSATWSKAWKQWVIRLSGEDIPLGIDGGATLERRRTEELGKWYTRGKSPRHWRKALLTINELCEERTSHVQTRYENDQRDPDAEITAHELAFRLLRQTYGEEPADEFDVLKLEELRRQLCLQQVQRRGRTVNVTKTWVDKQVGYIRRTFKWAHRERRIAQYVWSDLQSLEPMRRSETVARVNPAVEPVSIEHLKKLLPYLPPTLRAMLEVHLITGMRSGELVQMTPAMIDRRDQVWHYVPAKRKTAHHHWNPTIMLNTTCQELLLPYLSVRGPNEAIFSPRDAAEERRATKRALRKSKVQPSQVSRRKLSPIKVPTTTYTSNTYRQALMYATKRAIKNGELPSGFEWHPHQIRHTSARAFAQAFGLTGAQSVLGHKKIETTQMYVGLDTGFAERIAVESVGRRLIG